MSLYLKIVLGDWRNASRDKRELKVAKELGYDILVIASTKESRNIYKDEVDGFSVLRIPTRKFGVGQVRTYLGYIYGLKIYLRESKNMSPSIISGHNYGALLVGYLSQRNRQHKAKLVYDSHEYELCQSKKRSWLAYHMVKLIEGFLVHRADINMMVTDSIADEVQKIYALKERPLVIRNVPERLESHKNIVEKNRREFLEHLDICNDGIIIMFHGGLAPNRGIEQAILAAARVMGVGLVIMGYALENRYKESLVELVNSHNICERVYFKDAVPFNELYDYVAATDIGIVLTQDVCSNFRYSLPNKLFENIQAGTPVIGSNFPEIGGIISKYKVGIKITPDDVQALVDAISFMRDNKKQYECFKENVRKAREELCWQEEKKKLIAAIQGLKTNEAI